MLSKITLILLLWSIADVYIDGDDTAACQLNVMSGQLVVINPKKFSQCKCSNFVNSSTTLFRKPTWLLSNRNEQNPRWIGVPVSKDAVGDKFELIWSPIRRKKKQKLKHRIRNNKTLKYHGNKHKKRKSCYGDSCHTTSCQGNPRNRRIEIQVSSANSSDPYQFHCNIRWPTLASVILDTDLDSMTAQEQVALWSALKTNLKGAAGMRILEDVPKFDNSVFILASGLGNHDSPIRKSQKGGIAVVWQIGCGSVELRHLKLLQWLERAALIGELSQLISGGRIKIDRWFVADFYGPQNLRVKRQTNTNNVVLTKRQQAEYERRYGTTLLEGSGLPPALPAIQKQDDQLNKRKDKTGNQLPDGSGNEPIRITTKGPIKIGPSTPNKPVVKRKLTKMTLTIYQINNYKIPRETFYDPQDGYSPQLEVRAYYINPSNKKLKEVLHNDSNWVSYDKDVQNIRFLPRPAQIGEHTLRFCAKDKARNSVCEDLPVVVRPPTPITKNTVLQIAPGALWTHTMPSQWLDGLTYNKTSDLTISIEANNAIFCWDQKKLQLKVLTEAVQSRIYKIIFNIQNPKEYQRLKYEFTLAVSDVSPISKIVSDVLAMRLRWTGPGLYPLSQVETFLASLADVLSPTSIGDRVNPKDLLVYRVNHHRNFSIPVRDGNPDDKLELEIIYWPMRTTGGTNQADCRIAALEGAESRILERQQFADFYIDSLRRLPLKGVCNHAEDAKERRRKLMSTTTTSTRAPRITPARPSVPGSSQQKSPAFNSSALIQNFEVKAGHAFYKKLNIADAINIKLVRFLSLVDRNMVNVSDDNWIGLSNNSEIFGLPLKHHVRTKEYLFFIIIYSVTGHRLTAKFSIMVITNYWTKYPMNHMIKLQLKLNEKDNKDDDISSSMDYYGKPVNSESQMIKSLSFRFGLVQTIDRLLNTSCASRCGLDIILFDIEIIQKSLLSIEWSYLQILNSSIKQCPWSLIRQLYKAVNGISNYPIDGSTRQILPAQRLSEVLSTSGYGSVLSLTFERQAICKTPPSDMGGTQSGSVSSVLKNITAFCGQGFRVPIEYMLKNQPVKSNTTFIQIYYQNKVIVDKNYWMQVANSIKFIYGLPMSFHVTQGREYVLHLHPQNGQKVKVPFLVVVQPNPFTLTRMQPNTVNHIVNMRVAHFSSAQLTEDILSGLALRWRIAVGLDSYLRSECAISNTGSIIPDCAWKLDLILFEVSRAPDSSGFLDVKWAVRSILMETIPSGSLDGPIRRRRQIRCPRSSLMRLKRKLLADNGAGEEQPHKNLKLHMNANAGVIVKDVVVLGRGPCDQVGPYVPEKTGSFNPRPKPTTKQINQDDSQKMFLITTVIPVCAFTICVLFVALMIALCMRRRSYSGYVKASQNNQLGPGSPVILPDEIDRSNYPPSKPLILPHEKPPLPPPDYNMYDYQTSVAGGVSATIPSMSATNHATPNNRTIPPNSSATSSNNILMTSTFSSATPANRHHTPSILSSPNSHDRFPHGVFG